jgi:hypothetical protein
MKTIYLTLILGLIAGFSYGFENKVSIPDSSLVKVKIIQNGMTIDTTVQVSSDIHVDVDKILEELEIDVNLDNIDEVIDHALEDIDIEIVTGDRSEKIIITTAEIAATIDALNVDSALKEVIRKIEIDEKDGAMIIKTHACRGEAKDIKVIVEDDDHNVIICSGDDEKRIVKKVVRKCNGDGDGDQDEDIILLSVDEDDTKKKVRKKIIKENMFVSIDISVLSKEEKNTLQQKIPIEGKEKLDIDDLQMLYEDGKMTLKFDLSKRKDLTVDLFNEDGDNLASMKYLLFEGAFENSFNLKKSGVYILKIKHGMEFLTRKIDFKITNS